MNLKTIAKMAGVSTVTVSNVMNGKSNKASKETVERIMKIIEETNYRPSATARSLIMKQSRIIGVTIPNVLEDDSFAVSSYNAQILGHLYKFIRSQGYYMMLRCVVESREAIPDFATWNVDGAFLLGVVEDDAMMLREKLDIPAVFLDTYTQDETLATVGIEDYRGGYLAGEYLYNMGHRRIAFVGPPTQYPGVMQERYFGLRDALGERGVELTEDSRFIIYNNPFENGVRAGAEIASDGGFTAVAAMADVIALGVMEGVRSAGKRVPEDVSVIGFDDLPECVFAYPKLTTISQHMEEKARTAGEYLFSMVRDGASPSGCRRVDVDLVERGSVMRVSA